MNAEDYMQKYNTSFVKPSFLSPRYYPRWFYVPLDEKQTKQVLSPSSMRFAQAGTQKSPRTFTSSSCVPIQIDTTKLYVANHIVRWILVLGKKNLQRTSYLDGYEYWVMTMTFWSLFKAMGCKQKCSGLLLHLLLQEVSSNISFEIVMQRFYKLRLS